MAKIIVKLSVLVVLFTIFSILGFILYYSLFQNTYLASYMDKIKRLESLQYINKAVFIGGSATHFGFQAELFEKETNIPSVNMGLHGGGSFKMYIDNVLPYLKDGDMLFLCPEYEYYSRVFDEISGESIDLMYLSKWTIFQNTKSFYKIKTIPETLTIGWRHLGNIIKYHIALLTNNNYMDLFLGDYRREYSDIYGDYKGIKDIPNRVFRISHSIIFDDKMFISTLDKYADYLTKKNIEVYLLFPPTDRSLFKSSSIEIEKIYSRILVLKNIRVLFNPEEVIYNDDDFFNTYYHLNYNAAIEHTKYVISKYKNQKSR